MKRASVFVVGAIACTSIACSQRAPSESSSAPSTESRSGKAILTSISREPLFMNRIARALTFTSGAEPSTVALPAAGDAPFSVTHGAYSLEVTPRSTARGDGESLGGARVFRDVAPSTDAVVLTDGSGVEDLRVLRDEAAPRTFSWSVHASPAEATLRLREDRIELVDSRGYVQLAAAAPFAADAQGTHRALTATFEVHGSEATLIASLDAKGLAFPIIVDPLWGPSAPMRAHRERHTATLLPTGKVLVIGGGSSTNELYDPSTNTWSDWGTLSNSYLNHGAVLFASGTFAGKVFVVGGTTAELFDPVAKTTTAKTATTTGRTQAVTVLLNDGRVLVAGGNPSVQTAEVYSPTTNAWTSSTMQAIRTGAGGALLSNGKVLVAGGDSSDSVPLPPYTTAEIYDPTSNTWAATGSMTDSRADFAAVAVSGGQKVVVLGGERGTGKPGTEYPIQTVEVFDVTTGLFTKSTASLSTPHGVAPAALLPSGSIGIFGGDATGFGSQGTATDIFDYRVPSSAAVTPMANPRTEHTATVLSNGSVLVAGDGTSEVFTLSALGTTCNFGYECATGFCTDGVCCSTASCDTAHGFSCNTTSKKGACAKPIGSACSADADCETSHCADGVCCNTACNGQCEACAQGTNIGTCLPVTGAPATGHAACAPGGGDTCSTATCNGSDRTACHVAPAGTPCGSASCTTTAGGAVATEVSTCNGSGACNAKTQNCGAYRCNGNVCNTVCSDDSACFTGFYCDTASKACKPLQGLGTQCSASAPCTSPLTCVDGVCCATASCASGSSCANPGHEGTCTGDRGQTCTQDVDCGSGHCADGVCCDTACTGQCEACNATGAPGTCTPVTGAPKGSRPACSPGDGKNACSATACDGTTTTSCAGFAGSDVECRAAGCTDGTVTQRAVCDGKGNCPPLTTASCDGAICDATGKACMTSCTTSNQCVEGYDCVSGKCTNHAAHCDADGVTKVDVDNNHVSCAPYACRAGACLTQCATSDDCASGDQCDPGSKTCVSNGGSGSSGGCAASSSNASGFGAVALALAAIGAMRRRRQR